MSTRKVSPSPRLALRSADDDEPARFLLPKAVLPPARALAGDGGAEPLRASGSRAGRERRLLRLDDRGRREGGPPDAGEAAHPPACRWPSGTTADAGRAASAWPTWRTDVPATTGDRPTRLASISKPMTAVAVMQLVEQGKIDLDAPIERYVPSWPAKPFTISARQLLGHLGGIRWYRDPSRDGQHATLLQPSAVALAVQGRPFGMRAGDEVPLFHVWLYLARSGDRGDRGPSLRRLPERERFRPRPA